MICFNAHFIRYPCQTITFLPMHPPFRVPKAPPVPEKPSSDCLRSSARKETLLKLHGQRLKIGFITFGTTILSNAEEVA